MEPLILDAQDCRLLQQLQQDSTLTNQQLAERVGMSASPCWRRIRALEEQGVIQGYGARLDRRRLGWGVLAFIRIKIDSHSDDEARAFEDAIRTLDPVIACYSIAGDADFLLQVVAESLDTYTDFAMTVVRRLPRIKEMQTTFVLKEIKPLQGLPLLGS
ncbi:Lrp/AsnC family transcriptional regulator [Insolitispirillum peregrinum]|uniref:Transcriptional regulator, AsnC family n=1 Tax=Insolitispirillum peregrinum TaxID=80876 RepID=A0A1N7LMW9_9PROT|nr:Lrp/AsnC family transcriptional regulator [Insolitispirillum peregrinum]SIS75139.1 transcriptional regulator, AsnC family [Insolitispirillum peregrinum]